MNIKNFVVPICVILLSACAAKPPSRPAISKIPTQNTADSRLYISAGWMSGVRLSSVNQVGPVYINGKMVGKTAQDEYFAVDVTPGEYEMHCEPSEAIKNRVEKRYFTFRLGEIKYMICSMDTDRVELPLFGGAVVGAISGAISELSSDYLTKSFMEEISFDEKRSKLVGYVNLKDGN